MSDAPKHDPSDADLVERAAKGDDAAFERLWRINTLRNLIVALIALGSALFSIPGLQSLYLEERFNLDAWDACASEQSDWLEADAIGIGVDLGGRDDFAAWSMVARFEHRRKTEEESSEEDEHESPFVYRYECRSFVYIAEDTERDLTAPPFANWIHEGRIKLCKYPIEIT